VSVRDDTNRIFGWSTPNTLVGYAHYPKMRFAACPPCPSMRFAPVAPLPALTTSYGSCLTHGLADSVGTFRQA